MDDIQHFLDLHRADIDPEEFAAALSVQYISRLISYGGGAYERPDIEDVLHPSYLEAFLVLAVDTAAKTRRFVHEWRRLQHLFPRMKLAWEKGQALFQKDLTRAIGHEEEMGYLSQMDFALDFYASVSAWNTYPHDRALKNWAINGYMVAWRRHFLSDDDTSP